MTVQSDLGIHYASKEFLPIDEYQSRTLYQRTSENAPAHQFAWNVSYIIRHRVPPGRSVENRAAIADPVHPPARLSAQQIILDAIAVQLTHEPHRPTKNRKRLEDNPLAPWELRAGNFRVFYDVNQTAELVVIVAVGKKKHNTLQIGGEELEL